MAADNHHVEAFHGRLLRFSAVRKPALMAASSVIGLVVVVVVLTALFGAAGTIQLMLTLLVPATVMLLFWKTARDRIETSEKEFSAELEVERATYRATKEYLASVSHELTLHPERCSLRAEALAVAMEYRISAEHIKVVVPDVVVMIDPYVLRHILHTLISNAVRHGGRRIAVWATATESEARLTVSDDGPGVAQELGDQLFERFVDLGASALGSPGSETSLSIASELAELMGGELSYRRDEKWSHFTLRAPVGIESAEPEPVKVELEAQVG